LTGIADLTPLRGAERPNWLAQNSLPAGWRMGRYVGDDRTQPWRVAVRGARPDGLWHACETITVFGFTGSPSLQEVWTHCEHTIRSLNADNVVIVEVAAPAVPGVYAVSGSGCFRAGDRDVRGQHNFYVAGSPIPGHGRLVQQCLYVDAPQAAAFDADLALLGNNVHRAFVSSVLSR
jgi:hypothetical protein